jgi:hypothetical protein
MHRFALASGLAALCLGSFGCFVIACSSSSDNSQPADTGPSGGDSTTDSGVGDSSKSDGGDSTTNDDGDAGEVVAATTCGDPPYVHVVVHVYDYQSKTPVANALLTTSICPGSTFVSDSTGTFDGQISKGLAFDPRLSADSYVTVRLGEEKLDADFTIGVPMLPEALTLILPDWSTTKPTSIAFIGNSAALDGGVDASVDAADPCEAVDGISLTVTGHPEAKIVYFKSGAIPSPDSTLTATTSAGFAEIANLPTTAAPYQVTGTKTGCSVTFATPPLTGNYSLENGVLTLATGVVGP